MRPPVFKGNITVSNLPTDLTADALCDLFDQHGMVLGAKIDRWHDRPGGGTALIDLAPESAVETAIAALNGHAVSGIRLSVRRNKREGTKAAAPKVAVARSLPVAAPVMRRPVPEAAPRQPVMSEPWVDRPNDIVPEHAPRPAPGGTTRQVVVEYRAPRRVVLPPRAAKTNAG